MFIHQYSRNPRLFDLEIAADVADWNRQLAQRQLVEEARDARRELRAARSLRIRLHERMHRR